MSQSLTPIFDRWLVASTRARAAENDLSLKQVACLRQEGAAPTTDEVDALATMRAESAHLLAQAIEEVRVLASSLKGAGQPERAQRD